MLPKWGKKMYLFNSLGHCLKKILNFLEKTQNANDNCHYDKMMLLPIFQNIKDSSPSFLFAQQPRSCIFKKDTCLVGLPMAVLPHYDSK